MPDAHEQQGEHQGINDPADPEPTPDETQEGVHCQVTTRWRLATVKNLRSPKSLKSLIRLSFKVSGLYPRPCRQPMGPLAPEIQTVVQKGLAKATAEDQTFMWGASGAIRHWLDSIKPAMAATGGRYQGPGPTASGGPAGQEGCPQHHT